MKKDQKTVKTREPITKEALFRRNPVPFGDVRKYYYVACVGTVVLLALCFHISVAAIALRTDTCVQIPNGIITVLLICAVLAIIGHQTRTLAGYGLSAVCCLILVLVMQLYNGGLTLVSDLPEYGEVFRDGAKSTDFWILLAKVIAVVHLLLSVVFINSTLTVKEEPPLKGMNIKIQKIKDWLDKHNNSLPAGRRGSDYWFYAVSLMLWMTFIAYNPEMTWYDYYSMGLLFLAGILILFKQTLSGALCLAVSTLMRCTLYQFRFGLIIPVVAGYLSFFVALLFLLIEAYRSRARAYPVHRTLLFKIGEGIFQWSAVVLFVLLLPIHEFLNAFSGDYMSYQKDNLPLIFFIPLIIYVALWSQTWYAYLFSAACLWWLWNSLNNATPLKDNRILHFSSIEQHGRIGEKTTDRLMALVQGVSTTSIVMIFLFVSAGILIFILGRGYKNNETKKVD